MWTGTLSWPRSSILLSPLQANNGPPNRLTDLTHYRQDATLEDLTDNVVLASFA